VGRVRFSKVAKHERLRVLLGGIVRAEVQSIKNRLDPDIVKAFPTLRCFVDSGDCGIQLR